MKDRNARENKTMSTTRSLSCLNCERERLLSAMEWAFKRAEHMARCRDMQGWIDYTDEAERIGKRLALINEEIDAILEDEMQDTVTVKFVLVAEVTGNVWDACLLVDGYLAAVERGSTQEQAEEAVRASYAKRCQVVEIGED